MGGAIAAVALSREPVLTAAALVVAGAVWMLAVALFNIGVQLSAPRWVAGRSLAAFQASIAGGIAIGSWGWGRLTDAAGVETALLVSGALMFVLAAARPVAAYAAGRRAQRGRGSARRSRGAVIADGRSGPLVVEIEYRVAAGKRPRLSRRDAGSAAQPPAQRRLWLVDRARHRRSRIVDRALSLPDLAGLSAPAQSLDAIRTHAASAARSLSISGPIRCASAACWSGRSDRCAGKRKRRTAPPTKYCRSPPPQREAAARRFQHRHSGARSSAKPDRDSRNDRCRKLLPVSVSTFSQALLSRARCCLRQARTAMSPSLITARQWRDDIPRAGISCPCWADAAEAIKTNEVMKRILIIWLRLTSAMRAIRFRRAVDVNAAWVRKSDVDNGGNCHGVVYCGLLSRDLAGLRGQIAVHHGPATGVGWRDASPCRR